MKSLLTLATIALFWAGHATADNYQTDIDIRFDCAFAKPYNSFEVWITVTGQDGDDYRLGAATFTADGLEFEGDAILYTDLVEIDQYKAGFITMTLQPSTAAATLQVAKTTPVVSGTCEVRR